MADLYLQWPGCLQVKKAVPDRLPDQVACVRTIRLTRTLIDRELMLSRHLDDLGIETRFTNTWVANDTQNLPVALYYALDDLARLLEFVLPPNQWQRISW